MLFISPSDGIIAIMAKRAECDPTNIAAIIDPSDDTDVIEDAFASGDAVRKLQNARFREIRRIFGRRDTSIQTGKPSRLVPWITGLIAGLGAHRRGPTRQ